MSVQSCVLLCLVVLAALVNLSMSATFSRVRPNQTQTIIMSVQSCVLLCLVVLAALVNLSMSATFSRVRRQEGGDEIPYWCDPAQAGSAFSNYPGVAQWCVDNGY